MGFHSIPEPQENVPCAAVTSVRTPNAETDPQALSLLIQFFLLLDEWDHQEGQS